MPGKRAKKPLPIQEHHKPYAWFIEDAYGKQCEDYDKTCVLCKMWDGLLSCKSAGECEKYVRGVLKELIEDM